MKALVLGAVLLLSGCRAKAPESGAFDSEIDGCTADADCTVIKLDSCDGPSLCDEDLRAETAARAKLRRSVHRECEPARHRSCSARDVRWVGACRNGRCVVEQGR